VFDIPLFTVGYKCAVVNGPLTSVTTHPEMNKILQKAHCDERGRKKNVKLQYCGTNCGVCRQLSGAGDNNIDEIHPGYGFLSESAKFSRRIREEGANRGHWVQVREVLDQTDNKPKAKALAASCDVPIPKVMKESTDNANRVRRFAGECWISNNNQKPLMETEIGEFRSVVDRCPANYFRGNGCCEKFSTYRGAGRG
jgi:hypothetical protein